MWESRASSTPTTIQTIDLESQTAPLTQHVWSPASGGTTSQRSVATTTTAQHHQQQQQPEQHQEESLQQSPSSRSSVGAGNRSSIPVGAWRDDWWGDFWKHGCCHPTVLWSCCCPPIAMGQVATRLHLTWLGTTTGSAAESAVTFKKLFALVWIYWAMRAFLLYLIYLVDPNVDSVEWVPPSPAYHLVCAIDDIFSYAYFVFSAIILRNTRKHIRSKYAIPEGDHCPRGWEDCCCSLCCPCFTVAQMMRHTTDYQMYGARCCLDSGVSPTAPSIS